LIGLTVSVPNTKVRFILLRFVVVGVIVFSGDGYEFGFYDGANLAKTKNVIVVGANYRLGAFGFLAGPELQAEDPNLSTGNYALQVSDTRSEISERQHHRF
jgi:hypothetical protein